LTYYSAWTTTTRTNNNKKFVSILFCFPVYLDALQNDKRMLIRIITVFCGVSNNKEIGFLWVDLLYCMDNNKPDNNPDNNNNKKFVSILFCFPVYLEALQNDKRMLIRIITVFCGVLNNKEILFLCV